MLIAPTGLQIECVLLHYNTPPHAFGFAHITPSKHVPTHANTRRVCSAPGGAGWWTGDLQSSRVHTVVVFLTGLGKTGTGGAGGLEGGRWGLGGGVL